MENISTVKELIETLAYVVAVIILPVLATFISNYVGAKINEVQINTGNKNADRAIEEAKKLILDAVVQTAQTYSDNCKEESKDGKLTQEQIQKAFNKTRSTVYAMLSNEARKYIALAYGDVDRWLITQIEVAVAKRNTGNLDIN